MPLILILAGELKQKLKEWRREGWSNKRGRGESFKLASLRERNVCGK